MSFFERAFVPLWGRGTNFFWKPGGIFWQILKIFRPIFIQFLIEISLECFLKIPSIWFAMKKQLGKKFLIFTWLTDFQMHWKKNLICNGKTIWQNILNFHVTDKFSNRLTKTWFAMEKTLTKSILMNSRRSWKFNWYAKEIVHEKLDNFLLVNPKRHLVFDFFIQKIQLS